MNLMPGLLRPSRGHITILGIPTDQPEQLFRKVGYCTQFDSFPRGLTGREFVRSFLLVHGMDRKKADGLTTIALERVSLLEAGGRKVAAYSKGMRQRMRLAQAIAHEPAELIPNEPSNGLEPKKAVELTTIALERVSLREAGEREVAAYSKGMRQRIRLAEAIAHQPAVLILDEPLNGLDPMVRAETIALFRKLAAEGLHLIISSHILHEVDIMSDRVILLNNGYVVAEGNIHGVRDEMEEHPMQILIRCDKPSRLAAQVFDQDHVVEARLHDDRLGLFVKTKDADRFYLLLNRVVAEGEINIESVVPIDDDLSAVYGYLIGSGGGPS